MGLFSRLFGKKKEEKELVNQKSIAQPRQTKQKKEYETPSRTLHNLPDDISMQDFKLAGVARIDIIMVMANIAGEKSPYETEGVMYEALSDEGVIPVHLVVKKEKKQYGIFTFYTELEAANYKKFKSVLVDKCGFEDVYYISAYDPEKYEIEDGQLEKGVSFHAVFKKDENPKLEEYEGRYAQWWSSADDPMYISSPTVEYYQQINEALDRYGSYFCGMLLCGLGKRDFERILLPEKTSNIYVTGPNNLKCIINVSQSEGFQFLLPMDKCDAAYRHNLLSLISKSMVFLRKGMQERDVPLDDLSLASSKELYDKMIRQIQENQTVIPNLNLVTIGNPTIPKDKRSIDPTKVFLRLKGGEMPDQRTTNDGKVITLPEDQRPIFSSYQENLQLGLVMDTGYSYEYINKSMLADYDGSVESLYEAGRVNILNEISEQIKVVGDPQKGAIMVTCGGNHESALMIYDDFWLQIEEMVKSDVCVAIPVRDLLFACNFYDTEAMDMLRNQISTYYYDPSKKGHISNHIYLRKNGTWKSIEIVEK